MTAADFDSLLDRRLDKIREVLKTKAGEYANSSDRLHNFKAAAAIQRTSPEQALLGMLTKHLVSVIDIVQSRTSLKRDFLDEKLGDCINYLILLEAILIENRTGVPQMQSPTADFMNSSEAS